MLDSADKISRAKISLLHGYSASFLKRLNRSLERCLTTCCRSNSLLRMHPRRSRSRTPQSLSSTRASSYPTRRTPMRRATRASGIGLPLSSKYPNRGEMLISIRRRSQTPCVLIEHQDTSDFRNFHGSIRNDRLGFLGIWHRPQQRKSGVTMPHDQCLHTRSAADMMGYVARPARRSIPPRAASQLEGR